MDDDPPDRFLCPISRDVMVDPMLVDHRGHVCWFDRKCLEAHAKTRYADSNPLTNLRGFREAPRASDEALGDEIRKSQWAPGEDAREETICVADDPPPEEPAALMHEVDTRPELYRLLAAVDLLPTPIGFMNTIRHTVASLDAYVLDVLDDYAADPDMTL